jgi:hypothetical protein
MSLCELFGIISCAVFGIKVNSSEQRDSDLASRGTSGQSKYESSQNSSQGCYYENIVSREVFEKRKFFILWICLRVRMDSRIRSFSRMGALHPFLEFVQRLELELDRFPRIAFTAEAP